MVNNRNDSSAIPILMIFIGYGEKVKVTHLWQAKNIKYITVIYDDLNYSLNSIERKQGHYINLGSVIIISRFYSWLQEHLFLKNELRIPRRYVVYNYIQRFWSHCKIIVLKKQVKVQIAYYWNALGSL